MARSAHRNISEEGNPIRTQSFYGPNLQKSRTKLKRETTYLSKVLCHLILELILLITMLIFKYIIYVYFWYNVTCLSNFIFNLFLIIHFY